MFQFSSVMRRAGNVSRMVAVAALLVSVPAGAGANVKIAKNAFSYEGFRYYRGKADGVRLGSFGQKKTPATQANYLAVENHIATASLAKVNVEISGPYPIEWSKYSKTDIEASASTKYVKSGGATATLTQESTKSANLVLMRFQLPEGELKKLLNNHADAARKYLADEGGDGRVVSAVWIAMEASLASQVKTSGSITANGSANGIEVQIKASNSTSTTTTITLPPDTTFAYGLHKVKSWGKKKETIDNMEDDQHGPF